MTGSPSSVVMVGLGNGTFAGSTALILTMGFGTGVVLVESGSFRIGSSHGSLSRIHDSHGSPERIKYASGSPARIGK